MSRTKVSITPGQMDTLRNLAAGLSVEQTASVLGVSSWTVRSQMREAWQNVRKQTGLASPSAMMQAIAAGVLRFQDGQPVVRLSVRAAMLVERTKAKGQENCRCRRR